MPRPLDAVLRAAISPSVLAVAFGAVSGPVAAARTEEGPAVGINAPAAFAQPGTIYGHVFTLDGHLPIPGATVSWEGGAVLTASDGTFIGQGVPVGAQTITAAGDDWRPTMQDVEITPGSFVFLDLHLLPLSTAAPNAEPARGFRLHPASPNPTSGPAAIRFDLPDTRYVRLTIHDVTGSLIRRLESGPLSAGAHRLHWDARDQRGRRINAGVYFVRLTAGDLRATRKVTVGP